MTTAISTEKLSGKATVLATIRVTTKVGDVHEFPAMELKALSLVLPKGYNHTPGRSDSASFALVNASLCILSIPFNIIRRIDVDGEEWWTCPEPRG